MNKRDNPLKDKSFQFALKVVELYRMLTNEQKEFVMSKQLLHSGTSVGANICEAPHPQIIRSAKRVR